MPLPWDAADAPEPADWNAHFGHGASFGFSPARRTGDGAPAAEPHLPQPLWYGRYAVNVEDRDPDSMLGLYRTVLGLRASLFGSADDAVCRMVEAGPDVIAYTRTVADDAKNPGSRLVSMTNFGGTPVEVPGGEVVQFERLGYFAADPDQPGLFHRTVGLKDEWAAIQRRQQR